MRWLILRALRAVLRYLDEREPQLVLTPPFAPPTGVADIEAATDKWQEITTFLEGRLRIQDEQLAACLRKHEEDQLEKVKLRSEIADLQLRVKQLETEISQLRGEAP